MKATRWDLYGVDGTWVGAVIVPGEDQAAMDCLNDAAMAFGTWKRHVETGVAAGKNTVRQCYYCKNVLGTEEITHGCCESCARKALNGEI